MTNGESTKVSEQASSFCPSSPRYLLQLLRGLFFFFRFFFFPNGRYGEPHYWFFHSDFPQPPPIHPHAILQLGGVANARLPVDYILFIKANVDLDVNKNEVQNTKYVSADGLKQFFDDPALKFTPWFKLICNSLLFEWWDHLDSGLEKYTDEQEIRRML